MVQTAAYDPVVVEKHLTDEKVRELLERGTESAKLDYKSALNPSDTGHKVKLAKHAMAMANTAGGYIVIGAENDGSPSGLSEEAAASLDEATIRAQIAGYCGTPLSIFVHSNVKYDGNRLVIITILPLLDRIAVAVSDGNHGKGYPFRAGDVLVRHGSASERWNQADSEFLLHRISRAKKETWMTEFVVDFRKMQELSGLEEPPVDESFLELPPANFQAGLIRMLRKSDG